MKYKQIVPRQKVIEMIRRGWSVRLSDFVPEQDPVQPWINQGSSSLPVRRIFGYVLVDPEEKVISLEPRETASEAWDDILK